MIPAVAYYRMSTDKQDTSIDEQRREVVSWAAKNGFQILREYRDEGISGDATEKRVGFRRMIGDAANGDFEAILCWDQDRFGRFDMLEAGYWIKPLRDCGVRLVTPKGELDWEDFAGRVVFGVQQEAKHQYLRDLSRNVTRALKQRAQAGRRPITKWPFGYDKVFIDASGREMARIQHGGATVPKHRDWTARLVPSENQAHVDLVVWLYRSYADKDVSLRQLMEELNNRSVFSPEGKRWRAKTVREILRNPAYCGHGVWGRRQHAKYFTMAAGEIVAVRPGPVQQRDKSAEDWIINENEHPPLIDMETWELVQRKLVARRGRKTPNRAAPPPVLTGLLTCGKCGRRLHAYRQRNKPVIYRCDSYMVYGGSGPCPAWSVREDQLLQLLLSCIEEAMLTPGARDALLGKMRAKLARRAKRQPERVDTLRAQLAKLDVEIDRAATLAMRCQNDADLLDVFGPKLKALKQSQSKLKRELADAERLCKRRNVDDELRAVAQRIDGLRAELLSAEPARFRELLRRLVGKVTLWWRDKEKHEKSPAKWLVCRGKIEFLSWPNGCDLFPTSWPCRQRRSGSKRLHGGAIS